MNTFGKTLKDRCHVTGERNRFVGIKADSESAEIYFPIGRHLSDDERILCEDIITLLRVLYAVMKRYSLISARSFGGRGERSNILGANAPNAKRLCKKRQFDIFKNRRTSFKSERRQADHLSKKLSCTHKDNEQELFGAMLDMLKYMDKQSADKNYFFGTGYFERVF